MKLVSYRRTGGPYRSGVIVGEGVWDVSIGIRFSTHGSAALENNSGRYDLEVRELLEWDLLPRIEEIIDALTAEDLDGLDKVGGLTPLADARLGPPILEPSKIIAVALNYESHAEEAGVPVPKAPPLFPKYPSNLVGHDEPVLIPRVSTSIDYEGELAVVIGSYGSRLSASDWESVVLGYTVLNDVTARDYQHMTSQFTAGKCFDTFSPVGPWIVTRGDVGNPDDLTLETFVNGELRQQDNTSGMIFGVGELVEYISSVMTLVPGDIIATGTPGGVGAFKNPPQWLQSGDTMRVTISEIGSLDSPIRAA